MVCSNSRAVTWLYAGSFSISGEHGLSADEFAQPDACRGDERPQ
jgi:hypothetical protein